jgi:hypothetical protein
MLFFNINKKKNIFKLFKSFEKKKKKKIFIFTFQNFLRKKYLLIFYLNMN